MKPRILEHHAKAIRQFALQVLNTTLAVWIALSFEGLVEWKRTRDLVATARDHMRNEILDNRKDVLKAREWVAANKPEVDGCLKMLGAMIDEARDNQSPPRHGSCGVILRSTALSTSSRSTAGATGALGFMTYADAKRFTSAYEYQEALSHTFQRLSDHYPVVLRYFKVDFKQLSLDELRTARNDFLTLSLLLERVKGQSQTLLGFYDRALHGPG